MSRVVYLFLTFLCIVVILDSAPDRFVYERAADFEPPAVEGIVTEVAEASGERVIYTIRNSMELPAEYFYVGGALVLREDSWYHVGTTYEHPASTSPSTISQEELLRRNTIPPGEHREYAWDPGAWYHGEPLPAGEYCLVINLRLRPNSNYPDYVSREQVSVCFTVEKTEKN